MPLTKSKKIDAICNWHCGDEKDFGVLTNKAYQQHFLTYYFQYRHELILATWTIGFAGTIYDSLYYGFYQLQKIW